MSSRQPDPIRRFAAIGVAALLAVGIIAAVVIASGAAGGKSRVTVHGLSGSEKIPYLTDPRVVKRFHELGFDVQVQAAGSREIATSFDLKKYDFAFPAGVPAAEQIKKRVGQPYPQVSPFFTPMAIATFTPIARILVANGIATLRGGTYYLDVSRYLQVFRQGVRWSQLKQSSAYQVEKSVAITSTDVRSSNSAAMYLSLASYVANGNNTVLSAAQADAIQPLITSLFLKQGFLASSSEEPFDDYLTIGIGKSPMVMIYESQFLARAAAKDGAIQPDMVLMYPSPTVISKHTFVPLTSNGNRLGQALENDPKLQALAVEYGFRTAQPGAFRQFVSNSGVKAPATILNAIDPPSYEILEHMITKIESAYDAQNAPAPAPTTTTSTAAPGG